MMPGICHLPCLAELMLYFFRWALDHPWVLAANFHDSAVVASFPYLSALNLMLYFFRWALDHQWFLASISTMAVVAILPHLTELMSCSCGWALDHPELLSISMDGTVVATFPYLSALMLYFFRWALDHPWVLAANFHDGAVVATFPFDYYPPGKICSFLIFLAKTQFLVS
jgi:hypothetical protein